MNKLGKEILNWVAIGLAGVAIFIGLTSGLSNSDTKLEKRIDILEEKVETNEDDISTLIELAGIQEEINYNFQAMFESIAGIFS